MIVSGNVLGVGVFVPLEIVAGPGGGGDVLLADIVTEEFIYDGVINNFVLTDPAAKVLNVYIDNGIYPDQVPVGAVANVTVNVALLLPGNIINVQYIKA